jgi:hypothetical protein
MTQLAEAARAARREADALQVSCNHLMPLE